MAVDENWATLWESVADAMPEGLAVVRGPHRLHWAELDDAGVETGGSARRRRPRDQSPRWRSWRTTRPSISRRCSRRTSSVPVRSISTSATGREELAEVLEDSESEVLFFHGSLAAQVARARAARLWPTRRHTDRRWVTTARRGASLRGSDPGPRPGAPDTSIG